MPIDEPLLLANDHFEDPALGFSERFLQPELGGRQTVALLTEPLGTRHPIGWVITHSFGIEQVHLGRMEVMVARALAAAGFPVLRFQSQGYGDSEGQMADISLSSHVQDTTDAVHLQDGQEGVQQVGVLGARFGGLVAALVADRLGLPLLGVWEPVVRGQQFMRDFLRRKVFSEVVGGNESGGPDANRYRAELSEQGFTDINGTLLTKKAFDEISAADLEAEVRSFRGSALVLAITRSEKPGPAAAKLAEHLRTLGANVSLETLQDSLAPQFGDFHYRMTPDGTAKRDTQLAMAGEIARVTTDWARALVDAPAVRGSREG